MKRVELASQFAQKQKEEEDEKQFDLDNHLYGPTYWMPIEVWGLVFENLKSSTQDILNCRKVCRDFKEEADRTLALWARPTELDLLTIEGVPVKKLSPTFLFNCETSESFLKDMKNQKDNPFPTRTLKMHPKRCDCTFFCNECLPECLKAYYQFGKLSKRFGKHVHALVFTVVNKRSLNHCKKNLFPNFPNLRQLELKMVGCSIWATDGLCEFERWLRDYNLPPLPHLTNLKFHFFKMDGEVIITKLLHAYGKQIKTLSMSNMQHSRNFLENSVADLPNLKNLKLGFMPEVREINVVNFLRRGNWPLKQLTVSERERCSEDAYSEFWNLEATDTIFKFSSTLDILHLYFGVDRNTVNVLGYLVSSCKSKQEIMAKQPPRYFRSFAAKEISLPYACFRRNSSATRELCQSFPNLKTLNFCDDKWKECDYIPPNYQKKLNKKWWPTLCPESKLERVIILSGNEVDDDVVIHRVINNPKNVSGMCNDINGHLSDDSYSDDDFDTDDDSNAGTDDDADAGDDADEGEGD